MTIIYDLKNLNIIVVAIPKAEIQKNIQSLERIDGVLAVQEDSKMQLD